MLANQVTIICAQGHLSVQDLGRESALHLGFSISGVADEFAFLSANYLLKNPKNAAVLEITFGQVSLTVNTNTQVVITGANCNATINDKPIKHWQVFELKKDNVLHLSAPPKGVYSYISFSGGIQTPSYLGSKSQLPTQLLTAKNNMLAQLNNKQLVSLPLGKLFNEESIGEKKTIKQTEQIKQPKKQLSFKRIYKNENTFAQHVRSINNWQQNYQQSHLTLRFIPQPLWQTLSLKQQASLTQQPYLLTAKSNKMGVRLKGYALSTKVHTKARTITLSKPVTYGCIQIPPDGQPIVLMKDHQTIGGYPVLGYVIKTDLFRLAQMQTNTTVSFKPYSLMQAQTQLQHFYERFEFEN